MATGNFVKLARDLSTARDQLMPGAWVQECGKRFGQYCHLLLHVPPELDQLFRPMPLRWVKGILPGRYWADTLQSQKLGAARSVQDNPAAYEVELKGKLHYMLKRAPERLGSPLGLGGWWGAVMPRMRQGCWRVAGAAAGALLFNIAKLYGGPNPLRNS
ncbi:hypothetical protein HME9302_02088 [Alteripontixanthobacter maritimus]|uniref:Uncharacterized protein n=1 Tax=Alteripontixanthobacter maritimus TaxID=2161824 RepID=A0A369Q8R8_9SPHN|nr:hypothetical protein [Alteripontixanthobacter maritimus]RDC60872.1 hypothetical protein HME9302_02088 [Alteripontixanthobacter maritimus]